MCGIVGYIGKNEAAPILLEGLKRLEYRGYDSAGIAVINSAGVKCIKSVGRVKKLEKLLLKKKIGSNIGIAHTRWATHGKPSIANAHPHFTTHKNIFVVHNGIIENYQELKDQLKKKGHKFVTDTDSEVIAHLIEDCYHPTRKDSDDKPKGHFEKAVKAALKKIIGAYGLAIICRDEPDKIVAARYGSPLLIGIGKKEKIIASDAAAVIGRTKKVIYLEDGEIAVINGSKIKVSNIYSAKGSEASGKSIKKKINTITWGQDEISKAGYNHFMAKEIHEAPEVIINSTRGRCIAARSLAKLGGLESVKKELKNISRLIIVACGTARNAGLVGEYMIEEAAGIPVEVEYASEFRYRGPIVNKNTAVMAISQSGETADTLAAIKEAKKQDALTLGIVNVVGSSITRETDAGVYNHIGPEIAVASTKAYISEIIILALLTVFLGKTHKNMSAKKAKEILYEIEKLPKKVQSIFGQEQIIKKIARKYKRSDNFLYLGRKYNYPTALEGALKLKEISYIHAEGHPTGEMKHGPIAMIEPDFPSVFITPKDSVYEKNISGIEEVKARDGKIICIATQGDKKISKLADDVIYIPKTIEMLTPILAALPLHLLAYYIGVGKGYNVDKPRNLAKSVTVE